MATVYTIGHSTRPIDEFIGLLNTYGVKQLVDIRTIPGSRRNPQYSQQALDESLTSHTINYIYMKDLGGLRPKAKKSINAAWRNASFRNYADYMQTDEFKNALDELLEVAKLNSSAIMCAEAVPWRCHRSLVGDALLARGYSVRDIMSEKNAPLHKLTSFARVEGARVTYPAEETQVDGKAGSGQL